MTLPSRQHRVLCPSLLAGLRMSYPQLAPGVGTHPSLFRDCRSCTEERTARLERLISSYRRLLAPALRFSLRVASNLRLTALRAELAGGAHALSTLEPGVKNATHPRRTACRHQRHVSQQRMHAFSRTIFCRQGRRASGGPFKLTMLRATSPRDGRTLAAGRGEVPLQPRIMNPRLYRYALGRSSQHPGATPARGQVLQ